MKTDIAAITIQMLKDEVQKMVRTPGAAGAPLSAKTIKDSYSFIVSVLQYHKIELDYKDVTLPQIQASPLLF